MFTIFLRLNTCIEFADLIFEFDRRIPIKFFPFSVRLSESTAFSAGEKLLTRVMIV